MENAIDSCKIFLQTEYKDLTSDDKFEFSNDFDSNKSSTVWCMVRTDNLKRINIDSYEDNQKGALLLDPEIGVLLFILPYNKNQIEAQVIRALEIQSSLLPESNYTENENDKIDKAGMWRVLIHWFLSNNEADDWLDEIKGIRNKSAHFEEIPIDRIVNTNNDWYRTFSDFGFPRLLFTTRKVIKKDDQDKINTWFSADEQVEASLEELKNQFDVSEEKIILEKIIEKVPEFKKMSYSKYNVIHSINDMISGTFHKFRVKAFRNITDITISTNHDLVNSIIIQGPNGTGKSNFFEAISLALFKCSRRFLKFLTDKDITAKDRWAHYFSNYIEPIGSSNNSPTIWINNEIAELTAINDPEQAKSIYGLEIVNGTLLSQGTSTEFINMSADELSATILRGYSVLADNIEAYVENRYNDAHKERQDLLRKLNLNASITKIDTAFHQVTKNILSKQFPVLPVTLVEWLEKISSIDLPEYKEAYSVVKKWRNWGEISAIDNICKDLSGRSNAAIIKSILTEWLGDFNNLVQQTEKIMNYFELDETRKIQKELDIIVENINRWSDWLILNRQKNTDESEKDSILLQQEISQLQKTQQEIIAKGKLLKDRLDHFGDIDSFISSKWLEHNPNECPTCGTDLEEREGLLTVIEKLKSETTEKRRSYLEQFESVTEKIKGVEKKLSIIGHKICPLSIEEQTHLIESLHWLLPESLKLSEYISNYENREKLIMQIESLRYVPTVPIIIDIDFESNRVAELLVSEYSDIKTVFKDPDHWKSVKSNIDKQLGEIVTQHLPETLGKLWYEITMNMTSASWLYPGDFQIDVNTVRGVRKTSVKLDSDKKPQLVKYILNQAEIQTLGLAWFLTRYITHGRFKYSLILMDDPDMEMDPTTFREFCRCIETLLRLHTINNIPITLIVALHNESRAIDMAKATSATIYALDGKFRKFRTVIPVKFRTLISAS